jgi:arylsulfatase A-like enzyme
MPARYHETTWCAETALAFLHGKLRAPWFISMHSFAPHPPFDPPPEALARMDLAAMPQPLWRDTDLKHQLRFAGIDHQTAKPKPVNSYSWRHLVAAYYAQVEHVDTQIGRLLDALAASGQAENTIVILTSDHGEMLGDHGLVQKGCRFYEGAVHVPLILSWPGRFRQGLHATGLVDLADIVPTLLETLGMPVPEYVQGRSLRKICMGEADGGRHREFVRSVYHDSLGMPRHTHATMVRDRRYKLVRYHTDGLGELFDLDEDPGEFRNLFDDPEHLRTRNRLAEMLFDSTMVGADLGQPRIANF